MGIELAPCMISAFQYQIGIALVVPAYTLLSEECFVQERLLQTLKQLRSIGRRASRKTAHGAAQERCGRHFSRVTKIQKGISQSLPPRWFCPIAGHHKSAGANASDFWVSKWHFQ